MKTLNWALFVLLVTTLLLRAEEPGRALCVALDDWPPLAYSEDDAIKGISADVITRVMDRLDVPVKLGIYPFARAMMLAENGEVDAIAHVSYQPFRERALRYTDGQRAFLKTGTQPADYLWKGEYVFFVRSHQASVMQFSGYTDGALKDYRVGVVKRYSYNKGFRDAELNRKMYATPQGAFQALLDGEVDLVPMELTVGRGLLKEQGLEDRLTALNAELFSKPYHLVFTRKSGYPDVDELANRFHVELAKMRESGEYDSIHESYIQPDYLRKIDRPLTFVCEEWAPLEYMEAGEVKGVDASVVKHIMSRLGIPYRIEIYPWSRAWMMARNGKADAVLSISYKESRESVLYYTADQQAFGKTGKLPDNYLWMSEYVFFVMNHSAKRHKFESYEQIKRDGLKIGRNRDYSYDSDFLAAEFDGPVYATTEAGLLALVSGEIDLYPMDKTVGTAILRRLGLHSSVSTLPKPLFTKPYLSPFCKMSDFPGLEKIMNSFYRELRLMRADGTYDTLYNAGVKAVVPSE